ncbi:tRNA pseudouridine(38-40) synthase TruA [Butyrivibrio sp. YAB3001]|uniref:tRNA pseudouridine(38-40) synthase TruA n=1 Tax=Butyrivibrio sp. YAB3001 TaxID=1520812 RepID=UPI0008F6215D|nr:tRNA pseudouridine(38-40) synthase TruA [Butyrivibrio sp. YAB3001]SFC93135.1 tRNA pseudouridine38-40 synthase [Butyrivibrio sp. YAB3001]
MDRNYKLIISYDGTRYHGWERHSENDMTVQGKIENVLGRMVNAGYGEINLIGAGRTDAGVHARAMTANVILNTDMSENEIQTYLNAYLPEDISVNEVKICSDRFHARYNAVGKTYRYTCWYGVGKPVFDRKYVTILDKEPDIERMQEATRYLVGTHDFKSFCGNTKIKKSTVRTVDTINIEKSGSYIRFYFHGNGFLQNMVRILTGTLLEVGYGNIEPDKVKDILEACNRNEAGPTARPEGLCMMKVDY